jgi:hypothetical protein
MILREYFHDDELACRCGCGLLPPNGAVERLYALRVLLLRTIQVSSAARCRKHNKKEGGKPGSIHMPPSMRTATAAVYGGGAFDIIADTALQIQIISYGLRCGFTGFGLAKNYIHIDDAVRPNGLTYWRYA